MPSGVQPRGCESAGYQVSRVGSPPSTLTTYTWGTPERSDANAIQRPSGEKCGSDSTAGVLVRRRATPPARSAIQRSAPYVNATCVRLSVGSRRRRVDWP